MSRGVRKDHFDQKIFDIIDTEEKAYWIGFILADGNVHRSSLKIEIHIKDEEHLVKFKKFLGSSGDLKYTKNKPAVSFRVNSIYTVKSLSKHNVVPAKSRIVKMPSFDANLLHHFWRGYWDGDGWLSITQNNRHIFGMASLSKDILNDFRTWIANFGVDGGSLCKTKRGCWQLAYEGQKVDKILKILYNEETIYLDRKWKLKNQVFANPARLNIRYRDSQGRWTSKQR